MMGSTANLLLEAIKNHKISFDPFACGESISVINIVKWNEAADTSYYPLRLHTALLKKITLSHSHILVRNIFGYIYRFFYGEY